jgi:alpha-L-fucosidase 2
MNLPRKSFVNLILFVGAIGICQIAHAAITTDIEYGQASGEHLKLDASIPDGPGPFPAVILVHGGGWTAGDKSGGPKKGYMAPMHDALTKNGFAWFSINYRLAPHYPFPAPLEDVETAIRWVKAHAKEYHVDVDRIAISGESAGAHLVALAAVKANASTRVAAVVPFYGVFDTVGIAKMQATLSPSFRALFGATQLDEGVLKTIEQASPIEGVKAGLPPFLLLHGTADKNVPYQQSLDMQKRLRSVGVTCDLITIPEGPHGMLYWDKIDPAYQEKVVAWLKQTLHVKN